MSILEPGRCSMQRSRFCPDLVGFPPSFFNLNGTNCCSKSEVWPGCPTSRVSTAFCRQGFRPACARNKVQRDFTRNQLQLPGSGAFGPETSWMDYQEGVV